MISDNSILKLLYYPKVTCMTCRHGMVCISHPECGSECNVCAVYISLHIYITLYSIESDWENGTVNDDYYHQGSHIPTWQHGYALPHVHMPSSTPTRRYTYPPYSLTPNVAYASSDISSVSGSLYSLVNSMTKTKR